MSSKGEVGFNVITGVDPGYPQRGPYETSEGTYPDRMQTSDKIKVWVEHHFFETALKKSSVVVTQPKSASTFHNVASRVAGGPLWFTASDTRIGQYSKK